ncbi:hypothetical protein KL941_005429 [Ogataea angusta]|nr:hypothetical protein KL941_005429 [Ogataea angusta]
MHAHLQGEAVTHLWARVPELSEDVAVTTGRVRELILETELRNQQGLVWGVLDIPANLPSGSPLCGTAVSQDSTVKEILRVIYSHIQRVQVWRFHAHSLD